MNLFVALLVTTTSIVNGFTVPSTTPSRSSLLNAVKYPKDNRVVKAGGGIPIIPCGNNELFDPNLEGKIGNTYDRISAGHNYVCDTVPMDYVGCKQHDEQQVQEEDIVAAMTDAAATIATAVTATPPSKLLEAQHWLEEETFFGEGNIPQNFAKASSPVLATVLGRQRLIGEDAPGDIQHIVLQLPEGMHYLEGQSLSVIPPGEKKPRLYSIASTRYGDLLDGRTASLCVRRALYYDPETGKEDSSKKGVCSNFLCDVQKGDTVQVAGPVGKTMLLPKDLSIDMIMVGTGTGIAPFRAFLHRLFVENTVDRHKFNAQAWLILGVPVSSGLLYPTEFEAMQKNTDRLRIDYAISREMTTPEGKKLYVQDVLAQQADVLLDKLDAGATIYFCGLRGMMPGIMEALENVCTTRGLDFTTKYKQWKKNHQWHVEVY